MIAVAGDLVADPGQPGGVAGLAGRIAVAAAAAGAQVEVLARVGDDRPGDALLLALTRAGVGHAAVLRDPARPTAVALPSSAAAPGAGLPSPDGGPSERDLDEWDDASDQEGPAADAAGPAPPRAAELPAPELQAADLELALRYLTDLAVVVLAGPAAPGLAAAAADGAAFAGAALVVVQAAGSHPAEHLPPDATILVAPDGDPGGSFAAIVAEYAVALDGGRDPQDAWTAATGRVGAERA